MIYTISFVVVACLLNAAALRLIDERMLAVSDLYSVENGARLRLECFGTGNLQWTSSTGLEISSDESGNIYRSYDHTRDALTLVIQNFTNDTIATYTCMTDVTDVNGSPITISVLITSCKLKEKERVGGRYKERERERERLTGSHHLLQIILLSSSSLKFSTYYPIVPRHWKLEYLLLLWTRQLSNGITKEDS